MERDRRKWHLDKSINPGHLFSMISLLVSVFYVWHQGNLRQALTDQTLDHTIVQQRAINEMQARRDDRQDADYAREVSEIKSEIRLVSEKLDRLRVK